MLAFTASDEEILEPRPVGEPRTVKFLARCGIVAIGRWLMSGEDLPDAEATDGISEEETTLMEWGSL